MHSIFFYWNFNLSTTALLLMLIIAYLYTVNLSLKQQSLYFLSGLVIIIICIASPLHYVGENYLFSAHMLSHVLLLLIAAPLLVAGIPEENKFKKKMLFLSKKIYKTPLLSWITGVGIMWIWHVPYIFHPLVSMNGMQASASMNILMDLHMLSLLIAGMFFCWPVITPYKEYRIAPLTSVLYLSSACVCCSLLGLLITFAPSGTYTSYIGGNSEFLSVVRNQWNVSTAMDQQIGGLIMWVPCCFIYLTASMVILIKWFEGKNVITRIEFSNNTN